MTNPEWVPKVGDYAWMRVHVGAVDEGEAHVSGWGWTPCSALRPADEPSVDEMVEALDICEIFPNENEPGGWCVRLADERLFCGPTPTAAIRAAFEAVTKENT